LASMFHLPGDTQAPHVYGRISNPVWSEVEAALGLLEGAEAILFPSGMAAIAATFQTLLKAGDRILLPSDGYYVTRRLAAEHLARIDARIADLQSMRATVAGLVSACAGDHRPDCPILSDLATGEAVRGGHHRVTD
ncbi:MAG: PLP-dependent transferase, partial [Rhodobacteraceae bacterium]|nr:PLP-dependent transferase [Paracoccaceae bacterium]